MQSKITYAKLYVLFNVGNIGSQTLASVKEELRLGIQAVRTGREKEAKAHFITALKQDPDNIPAMLWLAFILPSPQDTIRLLKRVLALDPENERAKAGIRWAEKRLQDVKPDEALTTDDGGAEAADASISGDTLRQQLLSGDIQKQAKKGALAHRARRTINPLLVIIVVTGVLGAMALGLAMLFAPAETLAAFLPVASQSPPVAPEIIPFRPVMDLDQAGQAQDIPVVKKLTSTKDTIEVLALETSRQSVEFKTVSTHDEIPQPDSSLLLADIESSLSGLIPPLPVPETNLAALEPSVLIGPTFDSPELETEAHPVENLLLAHQPTYPGEKWIEVNVTTQQVTAWEGDVPVMSFIASTGLPGTPTALGEFEIYWKLESTLMTGADYYLPEVPYTMYFYGGYALHGTYWHNNFGRPMSHGCVNLETDNAQKLFEWADPVIPPGQTQVVASANNPGTLVVVHE